MAARSKRNRLIISFLIGVILTWFIVNQVNDYRSTSHVFYNTFLIDLASDSIQTMKVNPDGTVRYRDNKNPNITKVTVIPNEMVSAVTADAMKRGAQVSILPMESSSTGLGTLIFISCIPVVLLLMGMYYMSRRQSSMMGDKVSDLKLDPNDINVSFKDIACHESELNEVKELVDFFKRPDEYTRIGGPDAMPKGILMVGPPGTGKTLIAKAMAKESGMNFYSKSGSEFDEKFVGVGASRVRELFKLAAKNAPSIIFIDELDSICGKRGSQNNSGREQTLNQLLVELDGISANKDVYVIAATNRIDVLDEALLRPGRFTRHVHISLPDLEVRERIIKIHLSSVLVDHDEITDEYIKHLASTTTGYSGADLKKLCTEAAIYAVRRGAELVSIRDIEQAKDKVSMGEARKQVDSKDELKITAYHEAGHAIVGLLDPEGPELDKVTIIPRGAAAGVTMFKNNEYESMSYNKLVAYVRVLLAGRIAEEVVFSYGKSTIGASSDIAKATEICRNMITKWGFGQHGMMLIDDNASAQTKASVDEEIRNLLKLMHNEVTAMLITNRERLDKLASELLVKETLSVAEVKQLLSI